MKLIDGVSDIYSSPGSTTSYCARCAGDRKHTLVASTSDEDRESGVLFTTTFDLLRCMGCDSVSVRRTDFCDSPAVVYPEEGWGKLLDDAAGRYVREYWPGEVARKMPEWLWEIKNKLLADVLKETYKAFNNDQPILAASGTRLVFDLLANQPLGEDAGSFDKKVEALCIAGHIGEKQKEVLRAVIDAGSAAQHRAYKIPHFDLILIFSIIESLVHLTVLVDEKAAAMKKRTPPRSKKG